ncbi:MAG: hypothetical protein AAGD07_21940 [Planctomycetota bacterium]
MSHAEKPQSGPSGHSLDPHADKYNDPRAQVVGPVVIIMLLVMGLGVMGSLGSIWMRRTQLEQSSVFWGSDTITAFQLADRVTLRRLNDSMDDRIDLSGMPGLGHLRKALLDERHYDWESESKASVKSACRADAGSPCVELQFADPTFGRVSVTTIHMDLDRGVVGPSTGEKSVHVTPRVQTALAHQVTLLLNYSGKTYDDRKAEVNSG